MPRGRVEGRGIVPDPDSDEVAGGHAFPLRLGHDAAQALRSGRTRRPPRPACPRPRANPWRSCLRPPRSRRSVRAARRVACSGSGLAQTAEITAIPWAPAARRRATSASVTPPIAISGTGATRASDRHELRARRRPGVGLRRRRVDRTAAEVVGPFPIAGARLLDRARGAADDPMRPEDPPRETIGKSSRPRWTPSASAAIATSTRSLTMSGTPARLQIARTRFASRSSRVEPLFRRNWIASAPPRIASSASST